MALEVAGCHGGAGAIVVVAGHGQTGQAVRAADAEQLGRPRHLLLETQGRGVAGEDDPVEGALAQVGTAEAVRTRSVRRKRKPRPRSRRLTQADSRLLNQSSRCQTQAAR